MLSKTIKCLECGGICELTTGETIYPHRPDLRIKSYYLCSCGAYCGCHPGTTTPLGQPCGPETRKARLAAHTAFDTLWKNGDMSRTQAYKWLASKLGIDKQICHIGMMNAERANLVVEAVKDHTNKLQQEN